MDARKPADAHPAKKEYVAAVTGELTDRFGGRWMCWQVEEGGRSLAVWAQVGEADGRWSVTGVLLFGDAVRADDLRKVPISEIENAVNLGFDQAAAGDDPDTLPPLVRDPKMRPQDWSKLVAAHYTAHARRGPNPGAAISRRWGVNRQTVAAWVREARLRGFLPPARRTKAGSGE